MNLKKPPRQNAIAAALGISAAAVSQAKRRGMPVDSLEAARTWRDANLNRAQIPGAAATEAHQDTRDGAGADETFSSARRRLMIAQANKADLEAGEARGSLIAVAAVRAALGPVLAAARDAFLQIPARLAPMLAAESDTAAVQNLLDLELDRVLRQLTAGAVGTLPPEVQDD